MGEIMRIECFVYKITKRPLEEVGRVEITEVDPSHLISTRPYLNSKRLKETKRRRAGPDFPEGIRMNEDNIYFLDGHHKAKRASLAGVSIKCRVFTTENPLIKNKIERRRCTPISTTEIR